MSNVDKADQTEGDIVTGVEVVEGVLVVRRKDGSTQNYSLPDSLPTEDPAVEGAVWNDGGTVMVSGVTADTAADAFVASLPTADPMVIGALWNDNTIIKLSAQT